MSTVMANGQYADLQREKASEIQHVTQRVMKAKFCRAQTVPVVLLERLD